MPVYRFRYLGLLAACWTFVVNPALCVGGVFVHPCEVAHSEKEHDHHHHPDHQDDGCEHESESAKHPCREIVVRPEEQQSAGPISVSVWFAAPLAPEHVDLAVIATANRSSPRVCDEAADPIGLRTVKLLI